ncbi:MAG: hypothetical protein A2534_00265 [Candidatus Magasanikbacteria bacterium RIFOXYD2_FULL_39_9]|nr:MAG: hypothetical protein A2534_00265 [Candidatus Magasanikbacteria bacterium RIFOXYD2_FULL_39_9]
METKLVGTKIIKVSLIVFGLLIAVMAIFWAGMMTGFRKARFSYQWDKNYNVLFTRGPGHKMPPMGDVRGREFMDANSAFGLVIGVNSSTLIIKGDDDIEKSIFITNQTVIRRGPETIGAGDIKSDDRVVILGVPSSTGQIEARLIRLMPKL